VPSDHQDCLRHKSLRKAQPTMQVIKQAKAQKGAGKSSTLHVYHQLAAVQMSNATQCRDRGLRRGHCIQQLPWWLCWLWHIHLLHAITHGKHTTTNRVQARLGACRPGRYVFETTLQNISDYILALACQRNIYPFIHALLVNLNVYQSIHGTTRTMYISLRDISVSEEMNAWMDRYHGR